MLSVVVTSANPSSGVTVSNVVNSGGTITADIVADCTASNAGFTLTVTDSAGATATATLNVTVTANTAPVLTYDNQTVGAAASLTVNPATGPSDNGSVASFAVLSVTPALLTAPTVAGNGVVTITNAGPSGNHTITIRATDNCGLTTDASFTLNVTCPTLTLNPASLPAGTVGLPYLSTSFNATGGNGTVNYALSGTLPAKMAFVSGQLTDTPTEAGSFSLTITATDAYGCSVSKSYTLVVSCPTIIINPSASALPIAQINQAYPTQTFSASSGNAPYTLVLNGALPVGMSFANGQLSGTPTSFGSFPLTLNVTDKYGCTASRNYMLLVNRPPVALAQNVTVTAGANCTANADINNGSSDPDGDTLSFTQSPAGPYAVGTRTVTLTVDDGRGGVSTSTATVTVNAPKPVPVITGPASGTIYQVGTPVNFTGTFADLAGTTHTASWKFESATPPAITMAGTLVEPAGSNPGTTSVMQSFTTPGVYLMTLTVTNQCLGAGSVTTIGVDQFSALRNGRRLDQFTRRSLYRRSAADRQGQLRLRLEVSQRGERADRQHGVPIQSRQLEL
jgi:large repetitive protein